MNHLCQCTDAGNCPVWGRPVSARGARICREGNPGAIASYFGPSPAWTALRSLTTPSADRAKAQREIDPDTFITTAQLVTDTHALIGRLPHDLDGVVAIARSGFLPASVIATVLHLPLWQVGNEGPLTPTGSGGRMRKYERPEVPRNVALIDDTAASGGSMSRAVKAVADAWPGTNIIRTVVYAHPSGLHAIDLAHAILSGAHYLEWNFANAGHAQHAAWDFDGVLCRNDAHVQPLYPPRRNPIPLIITGRSEKHRPESVAWLRRHNITVTRMIMRPDNVAPDDPSIARWKGQIYRDAALRLYVESESTQGPLIAAVSGKPVLCLGCKRVIRPIPTAEKTRIKEGCCA